MNTDELIGRLSRDLRPVRPLAPPGVRAGLWLLAAAAYVAVGVGMIVFGMAPGGAKAEPIYLWQQGLAAVTGGIAAFAAFASVIPGVRRYATTLAGLSASAWLGILLWGSARDLQTYGTLGLGSQTDWPCVAALVIGGGALWAAMAPMLQRGVPMTPRVTTLLGGVAALSVANVVACLTQPHAFSSIVLLWHGGTMVLLLAVLVTVRPLAAVRPASAR